MKHAIEFHPIQVMTRGEDGQGQPVLADGQLVAVLVRLSDPAYGSECDK